MSVKQDNIKQDNIKQDNIKQDNIKQDELKQNTQNTAQAARRARMLRFAVWVPVLLWMLAIFCFSAQTGEASQAQSGGVGVYLLRMLDHGFDTLPPAQQAARVESLQLFIRKGAHMLEYALLGALFWNALRLTGACGDIADGGKAFRAKRHAQMADDVAFTEKLHAENNARSACNETSPAALRPAQLRPDAAAVWLALRPALLAVLCSALYAATDELHQLFVPGRSARWMDIGIDTLGALLGAAVCAAVWNALRSTRKHKKETEKASAVSRKSRPV